MRAKSWTAQEGRRGCGAAPGFTLIELLVAVVLVGVISTSIYGLLVNNQRVYRQQTERVDMNANVRAAIALLPTELYELNAADTVDSDIVTLGDTAIAYKAMRNVYFLCQPPVNLGGTGTVVVWAQPWYGLRAIDAARDSVFLFAEGDPSTRADNFWVHANVSGAPAAGAVCPGGAPGLTISLSSVHPVGGLGAVVNGSPLRSFELSRMLVYPDVYGNWWVGTQGYLKGSGWEGVMPLLGPVAPGGLRFVYLDAAGVPTATPENVVRIAVRVIGKTKEPVRGATGMEYLVDTLTTQVALRNRPR